MPQYVYVVRPVRPAMLSDGPTAVEEGLVAEHFEYLVSLADRGVVLMAGRTLSQDPSSFGIVLLECEGEDVARQVMEQDPAVAGGVFRSGLFPFRTAVTAPAKSCGGLS
jgi:uncharacterized protein